MVKRMTEKLVAEGYEAKAYPWGVRYSRDEEGIDWVSNVDVYNSGEIEEWHIIPGPGALPVTDAMYGSVEDWLNGVIAE